MDLNQIRRLIVVALFSDDELFNRFVLKGGNALELIHKVINRGSLDIDLAMKDEFEDLDDIENRIFNALRDRFGAAGFIIFDETFGIRPRVLGPNKPSTWGGYLVEFKLISNEHASRLEYDRERMRREAHTIGEGNHRKFRVEISKYEFCTGKAEVDVDGFTIYVYTPEMCVLEKVRAICQQMPEYKPTSGTQCARSRDFYDIHATVEMLNLDLASTANLELCKNIFAAKEVPLSLISGISKTREFHRTDWDRVRLSVGGEIRDFDYYFDYVAKIVVRKLQPIWIE